VKENLHHTTDEFVDEFFTVTPIATLRLHKSVLLQYESTIGGRKLESPQEGIGLLEVRADLVDLVDEVINAVDAVFSELSGDHLVVLDRETFLVDTAVTSLQDEFLDGLEIRVTANNVRHNAFQHVHHRLRAFDEDGLVELVQTEELEDFAGLRGHLVDTGGTDHQHHLRFRLDEEVAGSLGQSALGNEHLLVLAVFLLVLGSTELQVMSLDLVGGLDGSEGLSLLLEKSTIALDLLLEAFGDDSSLRGFGLTDHESFSHFDDFWS